jgi:hypothetical protein
MKIQILNSQSNILISINVHIYILYLYTIEYHLHKILPNVWFVTYATANDKTLKNIKHEHILLKFVYIKFVFILHCIDIHIFI